MLSEAEELDVRGCCMSFAGIFLEVKAVLGEGLWVAWKHKKVNLMFVMALITLAKIMEGLFC